jgi:hypothetical protein
MFVRRGITHGLAFSALATLPLSLLAVTSFGDASAAEGTPSFSRLATSPVFQNVPAGVDPPIRPSRRSPT